MTKVTLKEIIMLIAHIYLHFMTGITFANTRYVYKWPYSFCRCENILVKIQYVMYATIMIAMIGGMYLLKRKMKSFYYMDLF